MVSFRAKFTAALEARGIEIVPLPRLTARDSLLIIGGTRDLPALWRAKRRGVRIVQRLDGMNWLHRKLPTGVRHYLRAEYGNLILRLIRNRFADHIVYQSEFSRRWWERVHGAAPVPHSIVYNAVDLTVYRPQSDRPIVPPFDSRHSLHAPPTSLHPPRFRILLVEGSLTGGYELGLETAIRLVERLNTLHRADLASIALTGDEDSDSHQNQSVSAPDFPAELVVAGRVPDSVKERWARETDIPITWAGLLPPERIPDLDRSAHLLYAGDINAACPNAVIEALACGLPVLAFDTGALPELVTGDAGRIVPYGGDPWNLDPPDVDALARAALEILRGQPRFRRAARARAEAAFALGTMVNGYLQALGVF
jgi:glycosyltransferase involved in cell wall biosynthesis